MVLKYTLHYCKLGRLLDLYQTLLPLSYFPCSPLFDHKDPRWSMTKPTVTEVDKSGNVGPEGNFFLICIICLICISHLFVVVEDIYILCSRTVMNLYFVIGHTLF